jgi:peptidoglycan/LPS O-acetylase OafA/YrhL
VGRQTAMAVAIAFGLIALVPGVLIRMGKLRDFRGGLWVDVYRSSTSPWRKHQYFALGPMGVTLLLAAGWVIAFEADARRVGWALVAAAAATFAVTLYIGLEGPSWAKPRWLQQEDTARRRRVDGE